MKECLGHALAWNSLICERLRQAKKLFQKIKMKGAGIRKINYTQGEMSCISKRDFQNPVWEHEREQLEDSFSDGARSRSWGNQKLEFVKPFTKTISPLLSPTHQNNPADKPFTFCTHATSPVGENHLNLLESNYLTELFYYTVYPWLVILLVFNWNQKNPLPFNDGDFLQKN